MTGRPTGTSSAQGGAVLAALRCGADRFASVALLAIGALAMCACAEERDLTAPCDGCEPRVHPAGILDPRSEDFHGAELARRDWDFSVCQGCHGVDFRGNKTGATSCLTCHAEGPTACVTCHGAGPTSGAHSTHRGLAIACAQCHVVPASWDAAGHIKGDSSPAEVTFPSDGLAALTPVGAPRQGPPAFANGTCTNVYCHGSTLDAGGATTAPQWNAGAAAAACGACHGKPPPSHAQDQCATCHPASAPHVDGIVQIGRSAGCSGCHGTSASPAPPVDLLGNQFTTALGVGAHQAHLQAPSGLRGPIPCQTCHAVPTLVDDVGHIDSPLPAEVNASLGWDRTTRTCATASCHGSARPVWTETGGATCGSCHGVPPATASHNAGMNLSTCATCHPFPSTTAHIDGDVDVL